MVEALADMFVAAQAPQISWEGQPAYAIYEIAPIPSSVIVEFLYARQSPAQGLTLKVNGGMLAVDGIEASEMLLWRDTAPSKVTVRLTSEAGKRATLKLWNIWRGSIGGVDVTQAWLGNAGMRVDQSEDRRELLVCCSDGEGLVDFGNLEFRVTLV